jgi:hypothetical protein
MLRSHWPWLLAVSALAAFAAENGVEALSAAWADAGAPAVAAHLTVAGPATTAAALSTLGPHAAALLLRGEPPAGGFAAELFTELGPTFSGSLLRHAGVDFNAGLFKELGTPYMADMLKCCGAGAAAAPVAAYLPAAFMYFCLCLTASKLTSCSLNKSFFCVLAPFSFGEKGGGEHTHIHTNKVPLFPTCCGQYTVPFSPFLTLTGFLSEMMDSAGAATAAGTFKAAGASYSAALLKQLGVAYNVQVGGHAYACARAYGAAKRKGPPYTCCSISWDVACLHRHHR